MQPIHTLFFIVLALPLAGCAKQELPAFGEPVPYALSAGDNSLGPRLAQGANNVTALSWMERDEKGATLKFSTLQRGKWQAPVAVITDPEMFVNWADLPAVTPVRGDLWMAHWLSYSADGVYSYDVLTAQSSDLGQTWTDPVRPHTDGTPTEHGFVSLYPDSDGTGLIWLDGRNAKDGMTLRAASIAADGSLHAESVLDELICECCQTDVAVTANGAVAVYRDRTNEEIRDIYVTRLVDGVWQPGVPLANDGWNIAGCPVNGPVIDAAGDLVVAAWFTAAENKPLVQVVISKDSGKSFSEPVEIPSRQAIGRVGIAIIDPTSFAVSWLDTDSKGTYAINIRGLTVDGQAGPTHTVGRTGVMRSVPQLVRVADNLVLAWPDKIGDSSKIYAVKVPIR